MTWEEKVMDTATGAYHADKAVLKEVSQGNPAMEESSTTVHLLVEELNKYI